DVAEKDAIERHAHVPFELAGPRERDETPRDIARRRDEAAVADAGHQQDLPDHEESDRRDQIQQPLARLAGHLHIHEWLPSVSGVGWTKARVTRFVAMGRIVRAPCPRCDDAATISSKSNGSFLLVVARARDLVLQ